ncbi:MAG: sensor domain-containing diguanylate cyclase [Acidobacteria bacterium]|nr:sensor domain-containing diguanylate cyclase [Acidobacteriota bacterium]
MRLITRNDASLVVGLIAGTVVIFQRPLRFVWETAWDAQQRYHVDLLPALTIFVGVFIFHETRKRQQAKAEALAAAAEAAQARMRSAELERLMTFSQALANALDPATLQQALWRHLPAFAGERDFWVLVRQPDRWETFLQETTGTPKRSLEDLEATADRALSPETLPDARLMGIVEGDLLCFPMVAAGVAGGVLGIHDGATITTDQRKALGAATGLLAIAVRNVQLLQETREHSLRDSLTNCFNRGHGLETLDRELHRARRSRQPLSILMFDVDHFKTINDELGHLRGDDLLRAVGAQLTRVLRSTDVRCRYGGDEFLIILPDTPLAGAQQAAELVRQKMATLAMVAGGKTIPVTVSVGVAAAGPAELGITALIGRADDALYQAKREGRNRCSVAGVPAASEPPAIGPPATGASGL